MRYVLPVIVVSQFLCTTLWFVGNAVMPEVAATFGLDELFFAHQTSAVQFGFISGTLVFAILTVADRYSPSKVFFLSSLAASVFNLGLIAEGNGASSILFLRFATGFFLAGIYPVGMKIASDYFDKGLGKSLGFLVGALVLGTAFPHLLRGYLVTQDWKYIIIAASCLAVTGGILILMWVPDGPFRKKAGVIDRAASRKIFASAGFRSASFGYFGHMWELYAFWSFVPLMLTTYINSQSGVEWNISLWSFLIIGVGCLACIGAGYLSSYAGERTTATLALAASGICCLVSPLIFQTDHPALFLGFLVFWGIVVVADSPMFSTLVAKNTHAHQRGSALTLVNCVGFFITIVSIQVLGWLLKDVPIQYLFLFLAPGPALGLLALASGRHISTEPPL
ncbi:MAG: MFS transporter [Cyclobacteriaceae bacterium]|nr:MFS transporter [Cyclobacteriaceae bacterium]